MNKLLASVASAALIATAPAYAGQGGTHTDTDVQHKTVTTERSTTHVKTVHQPHEVTDTTVVRDVTREHPVHHVTDITRVLHHQKTVESNEYATHRHTAPEEVEHSHSEQVVGAPERGHEHVVTHYHDVNVPDYSTRVHEVTGSPVIFHEIHRHVTDVTVQPVVHEHDITRVIIDNHHVDRTEHEAVRVAGAARTVVTHKREDVDP